MNRGPIDGGNDCGEDSARKAEIIPTPAKDSALPSVLIALNRLQQEQFFPVGVAERLAGTRVVIAPTDDLKPEAWHRVLAENRPEIVIAGWSTPPIPRQFSKPAGGSVAYICNLVGSVRSLVTMEMIAEGLLVSNWGELAAPIVAEHALLLTLAALRNLPAWSDFMRRPFDHDDKNELGAHTLIGKHVAIYGFGAVARALVPLLTSFAVSITAFSLGVPGELMAAQGVQPAASLSELVRGADVLICCESLNSKTLRSLNQEVFCELPAGAVFVNVGRGAIVDESALVEVAPQRHLRVALDVYTVEPPPLDSPLRSIPGALFSPHIAGPTVEAYSRFGDSGLANIRRYIQGLKPTDLVSAEMYDRSS